MSDLFEGSRIRIVNQGDKTRFDCLLTLMQFFPSSILEIGGSGRAWNLVDSGFDDTVKYFLSRARARGILAISSAVFVEHWMNNNRHYYQVGKIKGPLKYEADN